MLDRVRNLRGNEFQEFCNILLSLADPTFQAVNGAGGDFGNDGFLVRGDTVFQAYAPETNVLAKVKAKIDDSIVKAVGLRSDTFPNLRRFIFLTPFDLTHDANVHLQDAGRRVGLQAESRGESKLTALLTLHPSARAAFPQFLLPDIVGEIRDLRAIMSAGRQPDLDAIFGPDREPDIYVFQNDADPKKQPHRAYEFFRIRVYSDRFIRQSFEVEEEEQFLELIRGTFEEDRNAQLGDPVNHGTRIDHRHPALRFHRQWGWWANAIGMAATLPDLHRPNTYSAADVAMDITRLIHLASLIGQDGPARVVFELEPNQLRVDWAPSDRIAREQLKTELQGIESVSRPQLDRARDSKSECPISLLDALSNAHLIAGEFIRFAVKHLHGARIRKGPFNSSILEVMAACARARTM